MEHKSVGTHNGSFHADDVLAVAVLRCLFVVSIIRTRDAARLAECDVVLDVGGVYDPDRDRYDHHQQGRAGARPNGVLYSAAGLVWAKYGQRVCGGDTVAAEAVDRRLIQAVCATDNGQKLFDGGEAKFTGAEPVSFARALSALNPTWDTDPTAADFDGAFERAVGFAQAVLLGEVARALADSEARRLTEQGLAGRTDPRVLHLPRGGVPWQETLFSDPRGSKVFFVCFADENGTHMIQCVPDALGSFGKRMALPEHWAGLRGPALDDATGVPGGVFCHPGRFIAGASTLEARDALLALALEFGEEAAWVAVRDRHVAEMAAQAAVAQAAHEAAVNVANAELERVELERRALREQVKAAKSALEAEHPEAAAAAAALRE